MTQKDMEARLIALEAEFAQKRHEIDDSIRELQNDMANAEMEFQILTKRCKEAIRTHESRKQILHVTYQTNRAKIYAEFAAS